MQKRILVPLDGSALADRIVHQVRRLLVRRDYEVVLLTVVAPAQEAGPGAQAVQDARDHLEGVRDALIGHGAAASARAVVGQAVDEIVRFAEELRPDLVCMATHGRTGVERLVRGSVAEEVLRRCPVPLLLANPHAVGSSDGELRSA